MDRRSFFGLALAALVPASLAGAQPSGRMFRTHTLVTFRVGDPKLASRDIFDGKVIDIPAAQLELLKKSLRHYETISIA